MSTAMDRIEAQLRFGNAIMASGVAESRFKAEKRAVKRKDRKDKSGFIDFSKIFRTFNLQKVRIRIP